MQSVESNILKVPFSVTAGQSPECEQSNDDSCPQLEVLRGRDGRDSRGGERGIPGERGPIGHSGAHGPLGRKVSPKRKEREALWDCLELMDLRDKKESQVRGVSLVLQVL